MRRILAGVATVLLMALLAWSALRRPQAEPGSGAGAGAGTGAGPAAEAGAATGALRPQSSPAEERIQALLASAQKGDVSAYLGSFDGPFRARLERQVRERGRDGFATDLRRASAARKSHAVFSAESDGPDTARVTVESVYPDHNERQTYRIDRTPQGWLVTEVETVRSHQPKAKYGTQASYQEPEGVPVQSGTISVETGEEPAAPPGPQAR
jgi:hypothetical protein